MQTDFHHGLLAAACLVLSAALSGCVPARVRLPEGPGVPFDGFAEAFQDASANCRAVRSLTAEMSVSGRVGDQRIRGRVLAGLEAGGSLRLEALAPFGAPLFVLAVRAEKAALLFPRDRRLLRSDHPQEVFEALTGLTLGPADLHAILAGCLVPQPQAIGGRALQGDWVTVDLSGGARAFLRRPEGRWRIVAGQFTGASSGTVATRITVEYADFALGLPARVNVWQDRAAGSVAAALAFTLSGVETNVSIDPTAFDVTVPAGVTPMTIEELRQSGPLAGSSPRGQ